MASATFALLRDEGVLRPMHNIKAFHKTTNKPITFPVMADSGAPNILFDKKYARLLGVESTLNTGFPWENYSSLGGKRVNLYGQVVKIQIGNLKPVNVIVFFSDLGTIPNIMGLGSIKSGQYAGILNFYKIFIDGKTIRYEEISTTTMQKQAAYADAYMASREYPGWYNKSKRI
jgi:hypothetical protein